MTTPSRKPVAEGAPETALPASPARELVMRVCATCHPIERVVEQRHTIEEWEQLIAVMVDRGATASDAEQTQIRDYLTQHFGLPIAGQ